MVPRACSVCLFVSGLLVASCGSDDPVDTNVSTDEVAASVVGRYAHYDVVASESPSMKSLSVNFGFTDLAMKGGKLFATESFCHTESRSDPPIITTVSDAAIQTLKPVSAEVTIREVDGVYEFSRAEAPTGHGIKLENPATDKLPTDPNDPRIVDDDHDGKPGVTVHIEVSEDFQGDLYIARREIFSYKVREEDGGALVGQVSDRSEQLLIGATNEAFLMRAEWTQVPDLTKSPIILKPVAKDWDCERLMKARDALFPPTPEVDW